MIELKPLLQEITALTPLAVALVALAGLVVGIAPNSFPLISVAAGLAAGQGAAASGGRRIEAFNSRFRAECLNAHWFLTLADAQEKMEDWRRYYNEERPHGAIGHKAPITLLNHDGASSPPS